VPKVEKSKLSEIHEHSKRGALLVLTEKKRYIELKGYGTLKVLDERGDYMLLTNRTDLPPVDVMR
jgi:hypothetical protein